MTFGKHQRFERVNTFAKVGNDLAIQYGDKKVCR
jgi:hypothetical protein